MINLKHITGLLEIKTHRFGKEKLCERKIMYFSLYEPRHVISNNVAM